MTRFDPPVRADRTVRGWGRGRLLLGLAAIVAVAVLLVAGLVQAARYTSATASHPTPADRQHRRRPRRPARCRWIGMGRGGADADRRPPRMRCRPPRLRCRGRLMVVPAATRIGPAEVATGFPHTPEGAVGQLAAIEVAVLQGMSIRYTARRLHQLGAARRCRRGRRGR